MTQYEVYVPGKFIVCGEHSVVYGGEAAIYTVGAGITLTATPAPTTSCTDAGGNVHSPNNYTKLGQALSIIEREIGPFSSTIHPATLPAGAGLGSSASLSAALALGAAAVHGGSADKVLQTAILADRVFNGPQASGADVRAVLAGAGAAASKVGRRALPALPVHHALVNTLREHDTAALVAAVRVQVEGEGAGKQGIERLQILSAEIIELIEGEKDDYDLWKDRINEIQHHLTILGVSTPEIDAAVTAASAAGASAKLTGAGGGGCVLIVGPSPSTVLTAARAAAEACGGVVVESKSADVHSVKAIN